jgi:ParB family chromosome partitioning protein
VLRTRVWGFELLAGERRWRAAQQAGLHDIPAIVRDDLSESEAFVLGLVENLQRESLSPMETAAGIKRLGEIFTLTHEQLGRRIGKSREYVSNYLRLLNLAPEVGALVNEGHLHLGHAKVIAGLPMREHVATADEVIRLKLTVRQLERRVAQRRRAATGSKPGFRPAKSGDIALLERELSDQIGYPVSVSSDRGGEGELRIRFHSLEELDGLLERLGYRSR